MTSTEQFKQSLQARKWQTLDLNWAGLALENSPLDSNIPFPYSNIPFPGGAGDLGSRRFRGVVEPSSDCRTLSFEWELVKTEINSIATDNQLAKSKHVLYDDLCLFEW